MYQKIFAKLILITFVFSAFGCQRNGVFQSPTSTAPATLRDVAAVKLNFRFETDVPAPTVSGQPAQSEERNAAIQSDFDQNRPQQLADKMIAAPNKQTVLVVYHKAEDAQGDFRLDMYSAAGKLLQKITHEGMAVHYPDTIVWSPDSANVAFTAKTRSGGQAANQPNQTENQPNAVPEANSNTNSNTETANTNSTAPTPNQAEPPQTVLTFRTEQIYICDSNGGGLKPITQNEGLVYFYFVWSPDGAALAALAATIQEWNFLQYQAESRKELFVPAGRLRLVEKTGRERRLDDNLTTVRPVWSPDSSKVADAFETQARIYDAIGDAPTQAAIPLRNQLLISSKAFDEEAQRRSEQTANTNAQTNSNANQTANTNANTNANTTVNQPIGTLPDPSQLVSFNPIISLEWTEDKMLYLQTGFIKLMQNEGDSAHSYLRWHRLIFSPQATAIGK
ncbi:MAG: hypothetical protein M3033_12955 [Acidobacteriota bacterium]|nr:hypothetical protein [Acidobacteriota bacterium]